MGFERRFAKRQFGRLGKAEALVEYRGKRKLKKALGVLKACAEGCVKRYLQVN